MTKLLSLFEWLDLPDSIAYLNSRGGDVSEKELLSAYLLYKYDLKISLRGKCLLYFKIDDPDPELDAFSNDGFILASFYGAEFNIINYSESMIRSAGSPVYVNKYKNSTREDPDNLDPLFIFNRNNEPAGYVPLTWGDLINSFPHFLLLSRNKIDCLLALSNGIEESGNGKSKGKLLSETLGSKERNTLLVVIAALCNELGIDWSKKGIASAIQHATEKIGAPVTDDTIRKVVDQIEPALERRRK